MRRNDSINNRMDGADGRMSDSASGLNVSPNGYCEDKFTCVCELTAEKLISQVTKRQM